MRSGLRHLSAWTLLFGLAIAVSASAWHHDHERRSIAPTPDLAWSDPEAAVVESAERVSSPSDRCPVCLSHRLLQQACAESPGGFSASSDGSLAVHDPVGPSPASPVYTSSARAPPLG